MTPLVVGVAGGSGSGKSTVVQHLLEALGPEQVALLEQDAYYRDRADLTPDARAGLNYDHPDAIDEALLVEHLRALKAGHPVRAPRYDFVAHARTPETRLIEARRCVVVEGILVLASAPLRALMDLRLYVETDADVRFIRRLRRDIAERGRTPERVMEQWERTVGPMHQQFVEPSKRHADLIVPEGGLNAVALEVILAHLKAAVAARG
ncbi:MAG TPA: uridine kinase [Armatimonadota bacterium]|nr:uridine kinase [Armatimonadota bacterium]